MFSLSLPLLISIYKTKDCNNNLRYELTPGVVETINRNGGVPLYNPIAKTLMTVPFLIVAVTGTVTLARTACTLNVYDPAGTVR